MTFGRIFLVSIAAVFGLVLGGLGRIAEPYLAPADKIARCEARHSPIECHRDFISPKGVRTTLAGDSP